LAQNTTGERRGLKMEESVCHTEEDPAVSTDMPQEPCVEDGVNAEESFVNEDVEDYIHDDRKWTVFEDAEDEIKYLRRRGDVLSKSLLACRSELSRLYEAGIALQTKFEANLKDVREAKGEIAYWRALAEAAQKELSNAKEASITAETNAALAEARFLKEAAMRRATSCHEMASRKSDEPARVKEASRKSDEAARVKEARPLSDRTNTSPNPVPQVETVSGSNTTQTIPIAPVRQVALAEAQPVQKSVDNPVTRQRQVPMGQKAQKTSNTPQVQYNDKVGTNDKVRRAAATTTAPAQKERDRTSTTPAAQTPRSIGLGLGKPVRNEPRAQQSCYSPSRSAREPKPRPSAAFASSPARLAQSPMKAGHRQSPKVDIKEECLTQ